MTAPAESVAIAPAPSHVAPLALWIVIQVAALALGASGAPLWARFDRPTEDLALPIVLAVQVAAIALLAPVLLRDAMRAALVIVSAIPFAYLASALSAAPVTGLARSEGFVAGWIALVAMWTIALPRRRNVVAAIASAVSIGGIVPAYLHNEFGGAVMSVTTPIIAAVQLTDQTVPLPPTVGMIAIPLIASVAIVVLITSRSNPTSYPQGIGAKL